MPKNNPFANPVGLLQSQQEGAPEVPPELQHKIDVMRTATIKLLHGKDTQKPILDMLSAGPLTESVPKAALQVNDMLEKTVKPEVDVVLANSVTLVSDLIEIADAAGIAPTPPEEEIVGIFQDTLQGYIEKGLKDGTIDPVELQAAVEPLMNGEQRGAGQEMMKAEGLPEAATQDMATEKMIREAQMAERAKMKQSVQQAPPQGMLQQGAQQPGGQQ